MTRLDSNRLDQLASQLDSFRSTTCSTIFYQTRSTLIISVLSQPISEEEAVEIKEWESCMEKEHPKKKEATVL